MFTLSQAYDLVSTWLHGDRELALHVRSKKQKVTRRNWSEIAESHAGLSRGEALGILDGLLSLCSVAMALVERSAISDSILRQQFQVLLEERTRALGGAAGSAEE